MAFYHSIVIKIHLIEEIAKSKREFYNLLAPYGGVYLQSIGLQLQVHRGTFTGRKCHFSKF